MIAAAEFLQWLRPAPWVLTAIIPDGAIETATFQDESKVMAWVAKHGGVRNIYYSLNPTKRAMRKKAEKADIAAAEFVHTDVDPKDNETPEQCKARTLEAIKSFGLRPSAVVDSGNGLQLIWRLAARH